jgi:hypothetical protein
MGRSGLVLLGCRTALVDSALITSIDVPPLAMVGILIPSRIRRVVFRWWREGAEAII